MSNYRSTRYAKWKQSVRRESITAYYQHKEETKLILENKNIFKPRKSSADAVVTIKLKGQPQMQFSSYKLPHGWTISPTLAGQKVQQVLLRA